MESLVNIASLKYILLILAIGLWLDWLWTRRSLYRFAINFPGYFGLPILGILYRVTHINDILPLFSKVFDETKEDTLCMWVGVDPWFITQDPETVKTVLSSPELLNKAKVIYDSLYKIMLGGLISSPAEEWHKHRKLLNPSFNNKVLVGFLPIFHKAKNKMIFKFETLAETGEKKINDLIQEIFFGLTVETTMGLIMKEDDAVHREVLKKISFLQKALTSRIMLTMFRLQGLFNFYKRYHKSVRYCYEFAHKLIGSKLQILNENEHYRDLTEKEINEDIIFIRKSPTIFIDHAIQLYQKQQFTWHDVIAESFTMITAAYETSSSGIFSILVMLAMHPEVQEKLYEEIVGVFPHKDFEMTINDMEKLPYLEMVIYETLRVVPPGPLIGRQVVKDTQLTKNIMLPKGLTVIISIFHLHRNKKVWGPNAHKFNPDNFLPENMSDKHTHAFIPFSKGARNCIGWRYAMFIMKVMIAGYVRNFRFTTNFKFDDLRFLDHITMKYFVEPGIKIHRR